MKTQSDVTPPQSYKGAPTSRFGHSNSEPQSDTTAEEQERREKERTRRADKVFGV